MNADHEEAVEFAKISKRENRVYVGNLSYDVRYRDLMEFMRGGGSRDLRLVSLVLVIFGELLRGTCVCYGVHFPGGVQAFRPMADFEGAQARVFA
jgi:hypothetical protein